MARSLGVSQGGWLCDAIVGVERKLADGTFRHGAQPLIGWSVGNVKFEMKGSASAITKQAAGRAKIDPVVALLNTAKLMAANPMPVRKPDYQMMIFRVIRDGCLTHQTKVITFRDHRPSIAALVGGRNK